MLFGILIGAPHSHRGVLFVLHWSQSQWVFAQAQLWVNQFSIQRFSIGHGEPGKLADQRANGTAKSESFSAEPKAVSTIIVRTEPVKSPVQPTSSEQAQDPTELNELKAKIWKAEVAQRNFAAGLPHCSELNGTNFYFSKQNRLLNLQDSTIWSRRECFHGIDRMPTSDGHRCKNRRPPIKPTARQSRACRPSGKN